MCILRFDFILAQEAAYFGLQLFRRVASVEGSVFFKLDDAIEFFYHVPSFVDRSK